MNSYGYKKEFEIMQLRIDKFLADMGVGTRSEVKQYIRKKQVQLNGSIVAKPEQKVNPETDQITFQGQKVGYVEKEYFMLYKPQNCVSATTDATHKTVLDYINTKKRKDLFPVGRLDIDTEGLLLITNDGKLAHELLSPKKHVEKTYYAKIQGKVTKEDVAYFQHGLDIGEKDLTKPAMLHVITSDTISEIEVTITEGKYHQVKRMFEAVGKKVIYLKRISMGPLQLDETLQPGEYRELTEEEKAALSPIMYTDKI